MCERLISLSIPSASRPSGESIQSPSEPVVVYAIVSQTVPHWTPYRRGSSFAAVFDLISGDHARRLHGLQDPLVLRVVVLARAEQREREGAIDQLAVQVDAAVPLGPDLLHHLAE
jgi:hypothetical protein